MRDFLEQSKEINRKIEQLEVYRRDLEQTILLKQNSVLGEKEDKILDKKITAINNVFRDVSTKVQQMIKANQEATEKLRKSSGSAKEEMDMRDLHTFKQGKDLSNVLRNYQNTQYNYKEREHARLREAYLIAHPDASDKDIQKFEEIGTDETAMSIAFSLGSRSAKGIIMEAKQRRKKIEKISEMIKTLVGLIEEIDKVVKKNKNTVDHITINMTTAEAHTEQAARELTSALEHERTAMRIKRIIFIVVVVIIIFVLLYFFGNWIQPAWKGGYGSWNR
jgi:t-SNARE complex subunit (syntaxin)